MLECCHFLISTMFEGNPYNYVHSAFGDQRDKYSVFYLAGNDLLLDTTIKRGFDPIKIARSLRKFDHSFLFCSSFFTGYCNVLNIIVFYLSWSICRLHR